MTTVLNLIAKVLKRLAYFCERLAQTPLAHNQRVQAASRNHDMARHPDEPFYAQQYLHWIRGAVVTTFPGDVARVLDLGCGQGRLAIPISKFSKQVVAVDFTATAIEAARGYAAEAGCANIEFAVSDILEYVRKQPSENFDVVVFTEVTFFLPNYKEVLSEIFRVLKPNGLAFISFRSQYFDILYSLRQKKWDSALMAIQKREGYLWGGSTWFSWQTKEDIHGLLKQSGYNQINCKGIGPCSGIEGDPLEGIARPSLLDALGQKRLQDIEIQLAEKYADNGRYILAIAKKQAI